jgi:flavin-dependent dehydrogenase
MEYYAVVLGGGVAGATAALAVARTHHRVALIDANPTAQWKIGETLAPESRSILSSLGLLETFLQAGHLPCYGNASAWGLNALTEKDFIFNPHGNAWQLDRIVFEEMLTLAAVKAGAVVFRGKLVEDIGQIDDIWRINFRDKTLTSKWLIDATGRRSMTSKKMGLKRQVLDHLVSIYCVAISQTGTDHDSRTFIESCSDGWWYSSLMPGGRRTIAFQTDADLLPGQEWRTLDWFIEQFGRTRHISRLLNGHDYVFTRPPQLTSARSSRLERFSDDGRMVIGDAAMSFDPLSGQGLLKAMQSGIKAAEVASNAKAMDRKAFDSWNEQVWEQFSNSRKYYYAMERRWPRTVFWQRR